MNPPQTQRRGRGRPRKSPRSDKAILEHRPISRKKKPKSKRFSRAPKVPAMHKRLENLINLLDTFGPDELSFVEHGGGNYEQGYSGGIRDAVAVENLTQRFQGRISVFYELQVSG
jgi:hypothetical protein